MVDAPKLPPATIGLAVRIVHFRIELEGPLSTRFTFTFLGSTLLRSTTVRHEVMSHRLFSPQRLHVLQGTNGVTLKRHVVIHYEFQILSKMLFSQKLVNSKTRMLNAQPNAIFLWL